jgi:atypical dual specificity phosphatase
MQQLNLPPGQQHHHMDAYNEPVCVFEDWLFIGGFHAAQNEPFLRKHKIEYIFRAVYDEESSGFAGIAYECHPLEDDDRQELSHAMRTCLEFLRAAKSENKRALVHCHAGISRSAALIIGYLILDHRMALMDAWTLVKLNSPSARPNNSFMEQLGRLADRVSCHHPTPLKAHLIASIVPEDRLE